MIDGKRIIQLCLVAAVMATLSYFATIETTVLTTRPPRLAIAALSSIAVIIWYAIKMPELKRPSMALRHGLASGYISALLAYIVFEWHSVYSLGSNPDRWRHLLGAVVAVPFLTLIPFTGALAFLFGSFLQRLYSD